MACAQAQLLTKNIDGCNCLVLLWLVVKPHHASSRPSCKQPPALVAAWVAPQWQNINHLLCVLVLLVCTLSTHVQGVTQVSQMVQYPGDPSIDTPPVWVAHFAHPIEVEWVARAAPAPKDWPRLLLQVGGCHMH